MRIRTLDDIPQWFRAQEDSIRWLRLLFEREIDLEGLFDHRYVVVTNHPTDEPPAPIDIHGIREPDQLEEFARRCLFGEEDILLIRDQERGVYLEPHVEVTFEERNGW